MALILFSDGGLYVLPALTTECLYFVVRVESLCRSMTCQVFGRPVTHCVDRRSNFVRLKMLPFEAHMGARKRLGPASFYEFWKRNSGNSVDLGRAGSIRSSGSAAVELRKPNRSSVCIFQNASKAAMLPCKTATGWICRFHFSVSSPHSCFLHANAKGGLREPGQVCNAELKKMKGLK